MKQIISEWATNKKLTIDNTPANPYAISEDEFEVEYELSEANQSQKYHNSLKILTIKVDITN